MILTTLLALVFLFVTIFFGWSVSWSILAERRIFALVPLSIIVGINTYNLLVNTVSYFVPIKDSVWIVLGILLSIALLVVYRVCGDSWQKPELILSKKQYYLLFGLAIVIALASGLVAIKSLALDDLFVGHLPLAQTIVDGNFPVVDPTAPDQALSYHYGADLLTANLNLVTGVPLWLGYDLQVFVFSGALFLMLFVLGFGLTKHYKASLVASGLFLYGTGLQWLYLFTDGLPVIWQRYVLGQPVTAFWKFLTYVAFPKLNTSFIYTINNHSTAIGAPVLILVLFLYFKALEVNTVKQMWIYTISAGIFFGYLALSLETYFIITLLALVAIMTISLVGLQVDYFKNLFFEFKGKKFFQITITIIVVSLIIAWFQGGIFSSLFKDADRDHIVLVSSWTDFITMDFAPDPTNTNNPATFVYLFSPEFFIQFGLPLLVIIPAVYYFFRRRNGRLVWLAIIGVGALLVPFLFRYPARNWEMSRFFVLAIPLFSFIVGLYLVQLYEEVRSKKLRLGIVSLIILVGLSGIMSQLLFGVSSIDRFGSVWPLVMEPPVASGIDQGAFAWIKEHTTQADRFFPYDENFIRYTGRFTPGPFLYFTFSRRTKEITLYNQIITTCSLEAIKLLKIDYLYVTPNFPIKNWSKCLPSLNAQLVYSTKSNQGGDFRYIYKVQ